jgi:hypothetical protein
MSYVNNLKTMIWFLSLLIPGTGIIVFIIISAVYALVEEQYIWLLSLFLIFVLPVFPTFADKLYDILRLNQ